MGEAFITRRGGGGSGGTLIVTGVAGSTVTASKDDKTYTRTLNSEGKATFKGLASGAWTITMTDGTQTVTRAVTITADYDLTIAYFSATILITYPAASTCIVTDSDGTQVASDTNGDSSAKTWTVTVGATGTYTVTAASADGAKTKSETVTITADGQSESVVLMYELILYDNGDQHVDITGGLKKYGATDISGSSIILTRDDTTGAGFTTINRIDLSAYTELIFEGNITAQVSGYEIWYGVTATAINGGASNQHSKFVAHAVPNKGTTQFSVSLGSASDLNVYVAAAGAGAGTINRIVAR